MGVLTRLTKRPKAKGLVLAVYRVAGRDTAEVMDDCLLLSYGFGCRRCHVGIQKKARALYRLLVPSFRGSDKAFLAGERATCRSPRSYCNNVTAGTVARRCLWR